MLHNRFDWSVFWAMLGAFAGIAIFRGGVDVIAHKLVPFPALYGAEAKLRQEDVVSRRRHWYWKTKYRRATWLFDLPHDRLDDRDVGGRRMVVVRRLGSSWATWAGAAAPMFGYYGMLMFVLFFINLIILFGPLFFFSIQQIKGYEPGDADWGVKLDDVRGQAEAKEEIRRVVSLWQSGEEFEKAGGKRERGVLFLGPSRHRQDDALEGDRDVVQLPVRDDPGLRLPQMFIGMDALLVRYMARKAKKLAAKWGGQCIVFIDEIDAVGMRRASLGSRLHAAARRARSTTTCSSASGAR